MVHFFRREPEIYSKSADNLIFTMSISNSIEVDERKYVQRGDDRRRNSDTVQFPLLDSDFKIIRSDRRNIPDRRKSNLKLFWQENQPIRHTSALTLEVDGQNYFLDETLEMFILGRSFESDIRIGDKYVSKRHAFIKYEDGEFVLQDTSLNGTFIEMEDLGSLRLQGQKAYLYGDGTISLGTPIDKIHGSQIQFHCK